MNDQENRAETTVEDPADVLLQQLLHLKKYEQPEASRMVRNKQNIIREIREVSSRKRWSLGDLLEVNMPWLFAEPRYGIAALFVVFAGLQYWGASSRQQVTGRTGIYTSGGNIAAYEQTSTISTNNISYPKLPSNLQLFPDAQSGDRSVRPASIFKEKE